MMKHIFTWFFKSILTFLVGLPITLLSPIITVLPSSPGEAKFKGSVFYFSRGKDCNG